MHIYTNLIPNHSLYYTYIHSFDFDLLHCSTIDPLASQSLAKEATGTYGLDMIDAPVSGGVTGAAAGT